MNLNVSLTDELVKYIEAKVRSGGYATSSDVVQEALKLLEHEDEKNIQNDQWLRAAWREGMESGDFSPLDVDTIKKEGRKALGKV